VSKPRRRQDETDEEFAERIADWRVRHVAIVARYRDANPELVRRWADRANANRRRGPPRPRRKP
jgi:hypothetical protein